MSNKCPHCGAELYGSVSRCYKCKKPVDFAKKARARARMTFYGFFYRFLKDSIKEPAALPNGVGVAIISAFIGGFIFGAIYEGVIGMAIFGLLLAFIPIIIIGVILRFPIISIVVIIYSLFATKGVIFTPFVVYTYKGIFLFAALGFIFGALIGAARNARNKKK